MSENKRKTEPPFPPLATVCKKRFPFSLACPSFVYPAGYVDNVRHLAPHVDEIELLFFESRFADSLPAPGLIRELAQLSRSGNVTYNVHLPTDICLGHRDAAVRQTAVDVLIRTIDRCMPLDPTTFTLHLERDRSEPDDRRWQANVTDAMEAVLTTGISRRRISVENLDYDFELAAPVVTDLDLGVCMDMGHLMVHNQAIDAFFDRWRERITILHLHGVDGTHDHLPLDRLSAARMIRVLDLLNRFNGVVSLEVFSFEALNASLSHLLDRWSGRPESADCPAGMKAGI
jgi:sugar phosphate isomerase/epimerase